MKSSMFTLLKGVLFLSIMASAARAQDPETFWHAAPAAFSRDPGKTPGSQYNPFTTIQAAVNAMAGGDTVYVHPGVYNESVQIPGRDKTILGLVKDAEGIPTAIIDGSGLQQKGLWLYPGSSNITVSTLLVRNVDGSGEEQGSGIYVQGNRGARIQDVVVEENIYYGINTMFSTNVVIEGVIARDNTRGGLNFYRSSARVINSRLLRNQNGTRIWASANIVLENNHIANNAYSGIGISGFTNGLSQDISIIGNNIYSNNQGISCTLATGVSILWNDVLYNPPRGINVDSNASISQLKYNNIWQPTGVEWVRLAPGGVIADGAPNYYGTTNEAVIATRISGAFTWTPIAATAFVYGLGGGGEGSATGLVRVTANIRVGASSLSVSPDTLVFDHTPAVGDAYAVSDELTLTFFAANGPWAVLTTSEGLESQTKTWVYNETTEQMEFVNANMPIKLWQASFGPAPDAGTGGTNSTPAQYNGFAYPDPDFHLPYWRSASNEAEIVWATAFSDSMAYKTHLTSSKVGDASPVTFRMGIDTFGMPVASDYSGVVDFDLVIDPTLWD